MVGDQLVPGAVDDLGLVHVLPLRLPAVGEVRVAVGENGEGIEIVHGVGVQAHVHHILHPDANHQAVLQEEAEGVGGGCLRLVGIVVIVRDQDVVPLLLEAVDEVRAVGGHDICPGAADVNAPGRADLLAAVALQQGDAAIRAAAVLILRVGEPEVILVQVPQGVDGFAIVPGEHSIRPLEEKVHAEGILPLLLSKLQKLRRLHPVEDQGEVGLRTLRLLLSGGTGLHMAPGVPPEYPQNEDAGEKGEAQPLPGEALSRGGGLRGGGFHRRFLRCGGELRHGDAELPAEGQEVFHIRGGDIRLPLADGLTADAKPGAQLLLGDAELLPVFTDPLAQGHGGVLLFN